MRSDRYDAVYRKKEKRKRAAIGLLKVLLLLLILLIGTGCLVHIDTFNALSYGLEPKLSVKVEKIDDGQYSVNCFGSAYSIKKGD